MSILPFSVYKISGHSMEPAIESGSVVLVWSWGVRPKVGDVVAVEVQSVKFKVQKGIFIKRIKAIKEGGYFLEGDNKRDSLDSRKLGYFKREQILGKVIKVI